MIAPRSTPWPELLELCVLRRSRGLTVADVHDLAHDVTGVRRPRLDLYTAAELRHLIRAVRTEADLRASRDRWVRGTG